MKKKESILLFSCILLGVCLLAGLVFSTSSSGDTDKKTEYTDEVIRLVNEERAAKGIAPLEKSEVLIPPADERAYECSIKFAHSRPDGSEWKTVFDEFGVESKYRGENLAYGQKTPERVMKAWMNSKGHRKNIMDERFTEMAVGFYEEGGVIYWSQLFMENEHDDGPAPVVLDESLPRVRVDGVNLNLRSQPSSKSSVVTVLLDGTEASVIGEEGSWTQVRLSDGVEGWASTKHLKVE